MHEESTIEMRILHITDDYTFTGGIRSYLAQIKALCENRGHEIRIFSPPPPLNAWAGVVSGWHSRKYYRAVKKEMAIFKPDLVHGHSISMRLSPSPLVAAKRTGIPVVMTVHDFNYVCPRKWLIYKDKNPCRYGFGWRCLVSNCPSGKPEAKYFPYHDLRWLKIALHRKVLTRCVDRFICPSKVLSDWMRANMGLPNVVCLPNFMEDTEFEIFNPATVNKLLYVGRLSPEKGVDVILKAMPALLRTYPGTRLTVVGDGPARSDLETMVQDMGIGGQVDFTGMVPNRDLPYYFHRSGVCIMPSLWYENCPVSGIEALAHARILVGSDLGGIPELVKDRGGGRLFQRGDSADLASQLVDLFASGKDELLAYSRKARELYQSKYSPASHYEKLTAIYSSVSAL